MTSPIQNLINAIASSPYRIAPERNEELRSLDQEESLLLKFIDTHEYKFSVNLEINEIITNIATLEYLWASTYAHLILYDEYAKTQRSGEYLFDTNKIARCRIALELAKWAAANLESANNRIWPSNYPMPVRHPVPNSDIHLANELFLCGVAWSIHHEIAHIRLKHPSLQTSRNLLEEKEADIAATLWILEQCIDQQEINKRTMGIAAAILAMQSVENSEKFDIFKTHPQAFERIDYCLSKSNIHDDDKLYAFCAVIMQIQLTYHGINVAHEGETYKEMFSEYLMEFARK